MKHTARWMIAACTLACAVASPSAADVDVQSYHLRALVHYLFIPDGRVNPYVGLGIGLSVNVIDTDKIEAQLPLVDVFNDTGAAIGGIGLIGLEVPIGDRLAIFAEGRVGFDVQLTSTGGDIDTENLGGLSGTGGIRFRF